MEILLLIIIKLKRNSEKNQSNKNAEQKVLVDNAIERLNALIEKSVIATNETVAKEIKIALADHRVDRDELLKKVIVAWYNKKINNRGSILP